MPGKFGYKKKRWYKKKNYKRFRKFNYAKPEKKFKINTFSGISIGAGTPVSQELTYIANGTQQNERIGNQIRVTGIFADLIITGADTTNTIRMIIYIPHDPSNTLSSLMYNGAPDMDQFTILYDKIITTSSNGPNNKRVMIRRSYTRGYKKGIRIQYYGSAATDVSKNRILIYVVSDSAAIPDPQLNGYLRMYYTDV